MEQIQTSIELIDKPLADKYLSKNNSNRGILRKRVEQYKRDMLLGKWEFTGESISFYENGQLKDGQHRLTAISECGIPQQFVVVRGIPLDNVIADKGQPRSTGQIAEMAGYSTDLRSNDVISAYKLLYYAALGCTSPSDPEVFSFLDNYGQIAVQAKKAVMKGGNHPIARKAPVIAAAFCALMQNIPVETLMCFFEVVNSGFCENGNQSAAIVLRKSLENYGGTYQDRLYIFFSTLYAIRDFYSETPRRMSYKAYNQHPWFSAVKEKIFNTKEKTK